MLSDLDLKRELGKQIGLYPFTENYIEGASIYFTASKFAWSLKDQNLAVASDEISIKANDTTIIFTNETISLGKRFAGTCHSKVSHTVKGISSSSTPIKPGWTGRLIIALHNNSNKEIKIKVGDTIAVIMLYKLKKAATFSDEKGGGGRFDLLSSLGIQISEDMLKELTQRCYVNRDDVLKKMKSQDTYKNYVKERKHDLWSVLMLIVIIITAIETFVLIVDYLQTNQINGIVALLWAPTLAFLSMLISKRIN